MDNIKVTITAIIAAMQKVDWMLVAAAALVFLQILCKLKELLGFKFPWERRKDNGKGI